MPFDQPMTDDEIRAKAPSVFATHPAASVSERYAYIPSYPMLRTMRVMGLECVSARQGIKRSPDGKQFALHELRFRKLDGEWAQETRELGQLIPEVIMRNSHDRTSPMDFCAGLRRLVCMNGMTVADQEFSFKARHVGRDTVARAYEGVAQIVNQFGRVIDVARYWASIDMTGEQSNDFVNRALVARGTSLSIPVHNVTLARRDADIGVSLWSVFNRVQENLTLGRLRGRSATGQRRTLPAIRTLKADMDFNRKLWQLASSVAAEIRPREARADQSAGNPVAAV